MTTEPASVLSDPRFKALQNPASEQALPLLGPDIEKLTPSEFYQRIQSLYRPRAASGKFAPAKLKGKIQQTATLKRIGIYLLRFPGPLGEQRFEFPFNKAKSLPLSQLLPQASKQLLCSSEQIKDFLMTKRFTQELDCTESERLISELNQRGDSDDTNSTTKKPLAPAPAQADA
jgi:hypothetical protein